MLGGISKILFYFLITLETLIRGPLFLFWNRSLFRNPTITVFWHWSFGHAIVGLDKLARLYFPNRISVIYIPHPRNNRKIPLLFSENMDVILYEPILSRKGYRSPVPRYLLRWMIHVIVGVLRSVTVVDFMNSYLMLTQAPDGLHYGEEETGKFCRVPGLTGYYYLIKNRIGRSPRLSESIRQSILSKILTFAPDFFEKPFITLHLRCKFGGRFDDDMRSCGSQGNYLPGVKWLIESGYHVVGTGETDNNIFFDLKGFYSFRRLDLDQDILNLFLNSEPCLFISNQSGSFAIAAARGVPVLVCDAFPYHLGTPNPTDLVLFKNLYRRQGDRLNLREVYSNLPDLAYGYGFSRNNIEVVGNDSEEILRAIQEVIQKPAISAEDQTRISHFYDLLKSDMPIYYQRNRPPLFILQGDSSINETI